MKIKITIETTKGKKGKTKKQYPNAVGNKKPSSMANVRQCN